VQQADDVVAGDRDQSPVERPTGGAWARSTGGSVAIPSRSSATAANRTASGSRSSSRAGRTWKDASPTPKSSHTSDRRSVAFTGSGCELGG
jgi:hypothetical protein